MKKLFMLVGMMILLIVITSASGCSGRTNYHSFTEGVFHWRYNPSQSNHELISYILDYELYIDEIQIEVKDITKEEYDASNFKNVIKHQKKEEYHSIIFKLKYSKETELTQYDMYDMSGTEEPYATPRKYPIKICLENDKYDIKGEVQFELEPGMFEDLELSYYFNTPIYVDNWLTINGTTRNFRSKRDSIYWCLEKDEPLTYSKNILNYANYVYIYNVGKDDCLHKLTEDLIIDEIYLYFDDITNE